MRRAARQILLGILATAAILEALYLAAANFALNRSLIEDRLNRNPQRFHIAWQRGWSWWPGSVALRGVDLGGSSKRIDWYTHLDSVDATFHLLPLRHNVVDLIRVRADGVDYRQRHKTLPQVASRVPPSELPPIPGLTEEEANSSPPRRGPGKRWTILSDDIACDVDQIWIDRFRLIGPMRVATGMMLVPHEAMEFPGVRLTMASGELRAGKDPIFERLGMDVQAEIHRFVPRGLKHLEFFHYLSGRFALHSDSASLFFLEAYFRKTPWVRFNDRGSGRFLIVLDHGRLAPGTELEMANDQVDMDFLDRHLTGKGVIRGGVEEKSGKVESILSARLTHFKLAPVGSSQAFARGEVATLSGRSGSLDLADPFTDLEITFDMPRAEILDLTFYNSLIPEGSNFKLLSGTGTISYHIEGSQEKRSLHGRIDLDIEEGSASFRDFVMRGGFSVNALLRQASPRELLFDIAGTRVVVHKRDPPWSAAFTFPQARMQFTNPTRIDASLSLAMHDTRPLVVMFDALKGVPDWLERMMTIPDIQGMAELQGRGDQVLIRDLDLTGKSLHALADLKLGRNTREGILFLKFHGFAFGVDLKPEGKDIKIIRPLRWFHEERAKRQSLSLDPKDPASGKPKKPARRVTGTSTDAR
ncbi:MAG TPA: hypothetical protein VFW45_01495 [Candidatus Polarisedimenticolia bacterium]|nr:hypothetical protein [Candidatus Polarisedimenticolia bacterium]